MTRLLDIVVALIGCLVLLPLLGVIALFIKLDSKGPVFYKATRVGQDGKLFKMYKFRTMFETPLVVGPSVSPLGDPRVTPVGRVLRRLKLNEFPQFFNILKGDMTLVGPRPETPDLAAAYPSEARKLFSVKPGLIGPNQILGRNEEELYPPDADPVQFYIQHILPLKLPVDLRYIEAKSFPRDLGYLLQAAWAVLAGTVSRRHLLDNRSQIALLLGDAGLCLASFTLAHWLRFDSPATLADLAALHLLLPLAVLVRLPVFVYFGFYHTLIRHLSLYDIKRLAKGVAAASLALVAVVFLCNAAPGYSRAVFLIDWFCLTTLLVGVRGLAWGYRRRQLEKRLPAGDKTRVLIWGAGDCGELCLRYLAGERNPAYEVVGFIDDDAQKRGKRLHGVKILGDRHHLNMVSQLYKIQQVFVALAGAPLHEQKSVLQACRQAGLPAELFLARAEVARELDLEPATLAPANSYRPRIAGRE
jgi:lipopolysaccharide/colanic/teichoic acid biosynthesis glycosyltransferase